MRIVVKVGTSTLAYGTGRLNIRHTEQLVKVLSDLKNEGHEVILVSSGAIGMGVGKLSLPQRPKDTASKQACAAVGQCVLNQILKEEQHTTVLLETMAGKGTEVGRSFEELAQILDRVELKSHMGVCLDTCHVYDAGYDLVGQLDQVLEEFDRVIGLERLKAIHMNDSKNPFASAFGGFWEYFGLRQFIL